MSSSRRDFIKLSTTFTLAVAGDSLLKNSPVFCADTKLRTSELAGYDAIGLGELIRKKQITPLELVELYVSRYKRDLRALETESEIADEYLKYLETSGKLGALPARNYLSNTLGVVRRGDGAFAQGDIVRPGLDPARGLEKKDHVQLGA